MMITMSNWYILSASLQGPELNYSTIEKHVYIVYKVVDHFQPYLLKK